MKTLFTYIPALGCSAMMVVCVVMMCGSRLRRRTPGVGADLARPPADAGRSDALNGVPAEVLAELATLRSEVAELRGATPVVLGATEATAARG